jgi:hypothetical protein
MHEATERQMKDKQTLNPVLYCGASFARKENDAMIPPTAQNFSEAVHRIHVDSLLLPNPTCQPVPTARRR